VLHPFIKHVHLHDNDGISDLHLPPGEGKIDAGSVLRDIWDVQPENVVLEIRRFAEPENVKLSILGSGRVGKAVGKVFPRYGFEVIFHDRDRAVLKALASEDYRERE
jgi:lactate dehydrogenase-like 2-hydroxyacid dehydrogenase